MPQLTLCCVNGDVLLNTPIFAGRHAYIMFFSGVWRLVAYQVVKDISEEHISSIFYSENTDSMLVLINFQTTEHYTAP
jgi:hypothetical protein